MTSPSGPSTVTTDPNVHKTPSGGAAAFDPSQVLKEFEQIAPAIVRMVLAQVLKAVAGISIFGVEPFAGLANWASDLQGQANTSTSLIGSIAGLFGLGSSSDLAGSPTSIWSRAFTTFIEPLISAATTFLQPLIDGVLGGSDNPLSSFISWLKPSSSSTNNVHTPLLDTILDSAHGTTGSTGTTLDAALAALQTQAGKILGAGANAASAQNGLALLQSAVTALTPSALNAFEQSIINTITLGQRTNKAVSAGTNATSEGSFTLGHFSSGGSVTTSTLAAGSAIGQVIRPAELATKGFIEFLGNGSSVTNIFVNLYSINPTTNAKTALWNSGNIATTVPSSLGFFRALIPGGSQPTVNPGDQLIAEIVNNGSNALTLAVKATGIPANSAETVANVGFTRSTSAGGASPTSLTSGQGAYGGSVPYVNFGIASVPADYHAPEPASWTVAGTYLGLAWPTWMAAGDTVDVVGIGGGGGGGGSWFYISGQGGGAAVYHASTLVMGTDIKLGSVYSVVVGDRGAAGTGAGATNGGPGGNTTLTYVDPSNVSHTITFTGGLAGGGGLSFNGSLPSSNNGMASADETYDGIRYYGGAAVGTGSTGQSPGGGGGGAISYLNGAPGGVGALNLYMVQSI